MATSATVAATPDDDPSESPSAARHSPIAGLNTRSIFARPHVSMSAMVRNMAGILGKYVTAVASSAAESALSRSDDPSVATVPELFRMCGVK